MKLGVAEYIDCAHSLPGHPKCGSLHGHTYKVEISDRRRAAKRHGRSILPTLSNLFVKFCARYDHRNFNDFLEYPSVENICELLSNKLRQKLSFTFTLRVWEGHGKWAEI